MNAKRGIILWVALHAILIILGISVPWKMDSDLYSILPDSNEIKNVSVAGKTLSSRSMRNITVLVGHENFDVARSAAVALDNMFKGDSSIVETRLLVNENAMNEMREFFFQHRYFCSRIFRAALYPLQILRSIPLQIPFPFDVESLFRQGNRRVDQDAGHRDEENQRDVNRSHRRQLQQGAHGRNHQDADLQQDAHGRDDIEGFVVPGFFRGKGQTALGLADIRHQHLVDGQGAKAVGPAQFQQFFVSFQIRQNISRSVLHDYGKQERQQRNAAADQALYHDIQVIAPV